MYGLTLTVPPTQEPITVQQLKSHLRIPTQNTAEDATVLPLYITAARMAFESWCGIGIGQQTYTLYLDEWRKYHYYYQYWNTNDYTYYSPQFVRDWHIKPLLLPVSPLQTVNWIKYYDVNSVLTTLDSSNYSVDATRSPGRILLLSFPSVATSIIPRIQINFTVGFSSCPVDLAHGILLLAADYFRQREASSEFSYKEVPFGMRHLVNRYKTWEVG